jgi:hypothetical protein
MSNSLNYMTGTPGFAPFKAAAALRDESELIVLISADDDITE